MRVGDWGAEAQTGEAEPRVRRDASARNAVPWLLHREPLDALSRKRGAEIRLLEALQDQALEGVESTLK